MQTELIPMTTPFGAKLLYAPQEVTGEALANALGILSQKPLIMLSGGAAGFDTARFGKIYFNLLTGFQSLWSTASITVIDGGTQAGIMEIIGKIRQRSGITAPLVGICPAARVAWPDAANPHRAKLDPNHSHFVLTSGESWGDETAMMFRLAEAIADKASSLAILINGGAIAKREILWNVRCGREVIVMQGSGRLADEIAAVYQGDAPPANDDIATIVQNGRITLFDPSHGPHALASLLNDRFLLSQ